MIAGRSKQGILVSLVFVALGNVAIPAGQGESRGDVKLGRPPVKPFYWLDRSRSNFVPRAKAISVNASNRSAVVNLFDTVYTPALAVPMGWTGNTAGCVAGTTSQAYIDATMNMINYFRAMSGLPGNVANASSFNDDSQEAALMMIAEGDLNHFPPITWTCYTSKGADAAANANLALGSAGPEAIAGYIEDPGLGNEPAGHRRWVLYPLQVQMGTGSTDSVNNFFFGSNTLYIFAPFGSRPGTPSAVAWPPEGFVPYQVVYPRWSLSLNSPTLADYSSATVTMTKDAANVPLTVISRTDNGFGDNTIVWEPSGLSFGPGQADQTVSVTVSNIMVGGSPSPHTSAIGWKNRLK